MYITFWILWTFLGLFGCVLGTIQNPADCLGLVRRSMWFTILDKKEFVPHTFCLILFVSTAHQRLQQAMHNCCKLLWQDSVSSSFLSSMSSAAVIYCCPTPSLLHPLCLLHFIVPPQHVVFLPNRQKHHWVTPVVTLQQCSPSNLTCLNISNMTSKKMVYKENQ